MAAVLTQAMGEEVVYQAVPADPFKSFGFPRAEERATWGGASVTRRARISRQPPLLFAPVELERRKSDTASSLPAPREIVHVHQG
jgi:hypothetical protein